MQAFAQRLVRSLIDLDSAFVYVDQVRAAIQSIQCNGLGNSAPSCAIAARRP